MRVAIEDDLYSFFLGKKRKRYSWSTPRKRHKKKSVPRGKRRVREKAGGRRQPMSVGQGVGSRILF